MIRLLSIFHLFFFCFSASGQNSHKIIVHTDNCNELMVGIYNWVSITALEGQPISEEQVEAYLLTASQYFSNTEPYKLELKKEPSGLFFIQADSLGSVEFRVNLDGEIASKRVRVKPIPAVCRLSGHAANSEKKLSVNEFKAQGGIAAFVECCGFDATCQVQDFDVIRIGADHSVGKAHNVGARFEEQSYDLLNQATSGDIYIFRNIYYRCPSSPRQRGEDMIFDIE